MFLCKIILLTLVFALLSCDAGVDTLLFTAYFARQHYCESFPHNRDYIIKPNLLHNFTCGLAPFLSQRKTCYITSFGRMVFRWP